MTNLNYLRYFYSCAQCGTFTKAAARLKISQPSLSIQIKTFEEQLGFRLFVRTGRSIQLTPKGQNLFLYASKIFEIAEDMEKSLKKSEFKSGSSLKIGVSDEVERPFVAEIVGRLIKANSAKKLVPSIISKKQAELVDLVMSEDVDLIITNEKSSELKLVSTLNIPVLLISVNLLPQTSTQRLRLQNIFTALGQDLILPTEEMILTQETQSYLKKNNIKIPTALTSNIIACITRSVQEKLGAAFLPTTYVQRELKAGTLQAFGPREGYWQHHLYLYTHKRNTNNVVQSLSKILQDFGSGNFMTPSQEIGL